MHSLARSGPNRCEQDTARYGHGSFAPHRRARPVIGRGLALLPLEFPFSGSQEARPTIGTHFFERVDRLGRGVTHRHQFGDVTVLENLLLGRALQLHDSAIKVTTNV